jgi:hypothetical protein
MRSVLFSSVELPNMWFNQPTYSNHTPYSYTPQYYYVYLSPEDPLTGAVARDRATREREAAAHYRAHSPRRQDTTRSPYSPYHSGDDDCGSFVPYPYKPPAHSYTLHVDEDLRRRQSIERERQFQLEHQAELDRSREAKRARKLAKRAYRTREHEVSVVFPPPNGFRSTPFSQPISTPTPHSSIPTSSPKVSPLVSRDTKTPCLSKYPTPPPSPKRTTLEATPEEVYAAMTIQEFYRKRAARKQALASIDDLSTQFDQFKSTFSPPPQLDYRGPTPDATIPIIVSSDSFTHASPVPPHSEDITDTLKSGPVLAFTSNNKAVHGYIENLNRLLDKLDRIESGGDVLVREERKQMIRDVEAEAQRMDRWIAGVWDIAQPNPQRSRQLRPQPTMEDVFTKN